MLVAAHKMAEMPADQIYLPVQVGKAVSDADLGYQPDNTGENISHLNRSYCELTAIYWAWKNSRTEVVGLCHYRRYFSGEMPGPNGSRILSGREIVQLMEEADIVLGAPRNYYVETIDSHYRHGHHGGDLDAVRSSISKISPQYIEAYDRVMAGRKISLYNMFIMKRELFDTYAEWLFDVLDSASQLIDNTDRSPYQQRTFGYLGERLLNVWVAANIPNHVVAYRPIVNTEGEPKLSKALNLLRRKFSRLGSK